MKKMVRAEKKKALKRTKNFGDSKVDDLNLNNDEDNVDAPTERKVDKDSIK